MSWRLLGSTGQCLVSHIENILFHVYIATVCFLLLWGLPREMEKQVWTFVIVDGCGVGFIGKCMYRICSMYNL